MAAPKPKHDSMDPFVSVDLQEVRTDRTELAPAQAAKLELVNADPRLDVKLVGRSTLTMLAFLDDEGPFEASVALKVDGNFVSLTLNKAMSGIEMVEELARNLPPGYSPATRESSQSDVLIVTVMRPTEEVSEPEVSFLATDPSQLFRWEAKNKLRIEGRSARGLKMRSVLDLYIEGYRVKLPLGRGDFPISTAKRLRDALPKPFCALIELPMQPGGDVTLTILRRR